MQPGDDRRRVRVVVAVVTALAATPALAGPPLSRDLSSYIFFGLRNVGLKNASVIGACNTGVNCAQPNSTSACGVATHENTHYGEGSQIAADRARFNRPGAAIWQLFSNDATVMTNVTLGLPPIEPLTPLPILGDVDGDGTASCDISSGQCVVDSGDLAAACGFPATFPSCNADNEVLALEGVDCARGTDIDPGNGRCDIAPGAYGRVSVQIGGRLTFQAGAYALCELIVGQSGEVIADGPTTLDVTGEVQVSNDASFGPAPGENCGQITVRAAGPGSVGFGRHVKVNGYFCGPERVVRLGHDNDLTGRFFGDVVEADDNNRAFCCASQGGEVCPVPEPIGPLRRDVGSYFALAQRSLRLKDFQLNSPCNVGVNCASTTDNSLCGVLSMAEGTFGTGTQTVGNKVFTRKASRLWQLFRNGGGPATDIELLAPPEMPFDPPIIPNTCSETCVPNVAALEAACGIPASISTCDPMRAVFARPLADCEFDTVPGNQRCDLAPGVYGRLRVLNDSRLALGPGQYVFCSVKIGRNAAVEANATTILLPNGGFFRAGNGSEVGQACGDLEILMRGRGVVVFGRHLLAAARVCAPRAYLRLGHDNTLIGQFLADTISSDFNNQGRCCCP